MRILTSILLLFFVSFVTLPTVAMGINFNIDASMVYNLAEEEEEPHRNHARVANGFSISFFYKNIGDIAAEHLLRYDNRSAEILLPPPERN